MQGILPILTLFLAPFSVSIPIKSFICPGFMFIQQALINKVINNPIYRVSIAHRNALVFLSRLNQNAVWESSNKILLSG
jgi:hypothetical protein